MLTQSQRTLVSPVLISESCFLSYVMMMPFKRQALVEFSAVESADRCVSCGAKEPVYIAGLLHSFFFYSTNLLMRFTGMHACS